MRMRFSHPAATLAMLTVATLISSGCDRAARMEAEVAEAKLNATETLLEATQAELEDARAKPAKPKKVQRFGSVIGLKPEMKQKYVELHAKTWPTVLERIHKSNIRNYSIYLTELDGKLYLFSYYEYVGDDYQADMQKIADDPETQRWWKLTEPCQIRLPGTPEGEQWLKIEEVFHTD